MKFVNRHCFAIVLIAILCHKASTGLCHEASTDEVYEEHADTDVYNNQTKSVASSSSKTLQGDCACENTCPAVPPYSHPLDCTEIRKNGYTKSGVYTIWPRSRILGCKTLQVYCDMETAGGGWTVILRRGDYGNPENYFYKPWKFYKSGFGNLEQDFWIGNENLFTLTNNAAYSVRFDLRHINGSSAHAVYEKFWILDEEHKYKINIEEYSGNAGDSMKQHNGYKFSTKDQHNGPSANDTAIKFQGAWWYKSGTHYANLNGLYKKGKDRYSQPTVVSWWSFGGDYNSLEFAEMKIRQNNF